MVIEFLTDPVNWVKDQYLWYFTTPIWFVAVNLLWLPALFLKAWLNDEYRRRRRVRRKKAATVA